MSTFCSLHPKVKKELATWHIDCLACVAALGYGRPLYYYASVEKNEFDVPNHIMDGLDSTQY